MITHHNRQGRECVLCGGTLDRWEKLVCLECLDNEEEEDGYSDEDEE